ncbi:hypothetical protein E2C01_061514 [Portunus trituberculatus]|uniref:Uncharacterized protein n=1 Tax=Portunus trituberculatus TaxID=210409 RepID=A0A5B7H5F2_PORTR|nr:hypothetical protein [Portunus trituberculatus]
MWDARVAKSHNEDIFFLPKSWPRNTACSRRPAPQHDLPSSVFVRPSQEHQSVVTLTCLPRATNTAVTGGEEPLLRLFAPRSGQLWLILSIG